MKNKPWKAFYKFKQKSIFFKNLWFFFLCIILPIIIFIFAYYHQSTGILNYEIKNINKENLRNKTEAIENRIENAKNIASQIMIDFNADIFWRSDNPLFNNTDLWNKLYQDLNLIKMMNEDIESVYIYSTNLKKLIDENGFYNFEAFHDNSWIDNFNESKDSAETVVLRKKNNKHPAVFTVITPVIYKNQNYGAIIINLDFNKIISDTDFLTESMGGSFLISTNDGEIYASSIKELSEKNILQITKPDLLKNSSEAKEAKIIVDTKKYLVFSISDYHKNIYYINMISHDQMNDMLKSAILFIIFILFCGIFISVILSYFSFAPLNQIFNHFHSDEESDTYEFSDNAKNEIKYITEYFDYLIHQKKNLKSKISLNELNLRRANNLVLQSQINPHFLYNTLDTINWKAYEMLNGENEVSDMICDLGEFYKYLLEISDFEVSVRDEIEYTKRYAKLLKYRYKNKFSIKWNIDDEIYDYKIIKLSLQPIIENAVYHGIKPMETNGIITVEAFSIENTIVIEISDNGVGISEEKLNDLKEEFNSEYNISNEHIGIANVNQRIKMAFGDKYGLEITSRKNQGTKVKMTLPKYTKEEIFK